MSLSTSVGPRLLRSAIQGAVHKVRHAIFWPILTPSHVTLCHTPRDPPKLRHTSRIPPSFTRPSTKTRAKAPVQIFSQLFAGAFVRGILLGGLCLEGFFRADFCPYFLLSEYICY